MSDYLYFEDERFWFSLTLLQSYGIVWQGNSYRDNQYKKEFLHMLIIKTREMTQTTENVSCRFKEFIEPFPSIKKALKDIIPNDVQTYHCANYHNNYENQKRDYEVNERNLKILENIIADFDRLLSFESFRLFYKLTAYGERLRECLLPDENLS